MEVFELSKRFPKSETFSLTDQIRRSTRSITTNIAEAWEKRRYEAAFIAKLTDSCAELAETKDWLTYASDCQYVERDITEGLKEKYQQVHRTLRAMISHAADWCK
jgi:four helix bundle protein